VRATVKPNAGVVIISDVTKVEVEGKEEWEFVRHVAKQLGKNARVRLRYVNTPNKPILKLNVQSGAVSEVMFHTSWEDTKEILLSEENRAVMVSITADHRE